MTMIGHELRKIFEWKRVLIVVVISILMHFIWGRTAFDVNLFTHPMWSEVMREMVATYGDSIDASEVAHMREVLNERIQSFEAELAHHSTIFATTFDEFEAEVFGNDALNYRWVRGYYPELDALFREINIRQWQQNFDVENQRRWLSYHGYEAEIQRWEEVVNREEISFFQSEIFYAYRGIISSVALIVVVSLAVLISPLYVEEKKSKMLQLQYSTKMGRRVFLKKIVAVSIAAFLVSVVQIGVTFGFFLQTIGNLFLGMNMSGFGTPMWYDITFGQFMVLTAVLVWLTGTVFATLTFFLSRISTTYIMMLAIQIVVIILLMANRVFESTIMDVIRARFDENQMFNPPFLMPLFYLGLVGMAVALLMWQWKRERRLDI